MDKTRIQATKEQNRRHYNEDNHERKTKALSYLIKSVCASHTPLPLSMSIANVLVLE